MLLLNRVSGNGIGKMGIKDGIWETNESWKTEKKFIVVSFRRIKYFNVQKIIENDYV